MNNGNQIKAKTAQKVKGDDVNLTNINQQSIYNFNENHPIESYLSLIQKYNDLKLEHINDINELKDKLKSKYEKQIEELQDHINDLTNSKNTIESFETVFRRNQYDWMYFKVKNAISFSCFKFYKGMEIFKDDAFNRTIVTVYLDKNSDDYVETLEHIQESGLL